MIASLVKKPTQPKIPITPGPVEKILDLLGLVVVILLWIYTLMTYDQLPDQVVVHLNFEGHADRLGHKTQLYFLPGLVTFLYAGLVWLNRYPHLFNYLVEITPENAARQYQLGTRFMRFINLSILTLFAGIHLEFIEMSGMDPSAPVENQGLLIMVGVHILITFFGVIFYMVKSSNAK
jgi:uncharacterized membrane protein